MEWTRTRDADSLVEWTREDGYVTVRRHRRPDGEWVVRLDRLYQAPEGGGYRRERVADVDAARAVVEAWKDEADATAE
ncbi:hypothetical protein DVK02_00225 [Halobellus sp. Atlit-31R]|nr:hypothetical protein DVK02_00225 [Halobellus sp. Atlit-31R]